eukprot:UN4866
MSRHPTACHSNVRMAVNVEGIDGHVLMMIFGSSYLCHTQLCFSSKRATRHDASEAKWHLLNNTSAAYGHVHA